MGRLNAVILDFATLNPDTLELAGLHALDVNLSIHAHTQPEEVVARIEHADIVLTNKVQLPASVLEQAKRCRYVGVLATGTNNIDMMWCEHHGVTVKKVENYGAAAVAQHTLMLLLNLVTSFRAYDNDVQTGRWSQSSQFCLNEHPVSLLDGKHAVIVGSGTIGTQVAHLLRAFGMQVTFAARIGAANDPRPSLESLLPEADVLSLHCPLNDTTQHLINDHSLSLMKPSAMLLNTARGGLVDEKALLTALEAGQLGGAGLDVLSAEPPPPDHLLLQTIRPNLIITPHCAWVAQEARQRLLDIAVSHVNDFLNHYTTTD